MILIDDRNGNFEEKMFSHQISFKMSTFPTFKKHLKQKKCGIIHLNNSIKVWNLKVFPLSIKISILVLDLNKGEKRAQRKWVLAGKQFSRKNSFSMIKLKPAILHKISFIVTPLILTITKGHYNHTFVYLCIFRSGHGRFWQEYRFKINILISS